MKYFIVLKLALNEIKNNKLRSSLTSLGIIIGVASVISIISLTQGARNQIENKFLNLGGKSLIVKSGDRTSSGIGIKANSIDLTTNDVRSIRKIENVVYTTPISKVTRIARYGNKSLFTAIVGTSTDFFYINNWFTSRGNMFTSEDTDNSLAVCVLGSTVAEKLFGTEEATGKLIRIDNTSFTVTGILSTIGPTTSGRDQDDAIIIPYTTMQKRIMGISSIDSISVSVKNPSDLEPVKSQITSLLRTNHNLSRTSSDGFYITSQENVINRINKVSGIMTLLLALVSSISLFVGGMGIMNIMLVSVIERTKEIGIRMAIGARQKDIIIQFLTESVLISLIGGLLGIVLGFIISGVITLITHWPSSVSLGAILIAFIFSISIGIFFGYYPAKKASGLDPIEALRYE